MSGRFKIDKVFVVTKWEAKQHDAIMFGLGMLVGAMLTPFAYLLIALVERWIAVLTN